MTDPGPLTSAPAPAQRGATMDPGARTHPSPPRTAPAPPGPPSGGTAPQSGQDPPEDGRGRGYLECRARGATPPALPVPVLVPGCPLPLPLRFEGFRMATNMPTFIVSPCSLSTGGSRAQSIRLTGTAGSLPEQTVPSSAGL